MKDGETIFSLSCFPHFFVEKLCHFPKKKESLSLQDLDFDDPSELYHKSKKFAVDAFETSLLSKSKSENK